LTRTLIVDGNSLLKTGFHGIKNLYNGSDHIGGLFHFLNTIRKFIENNLITKVIVFWDGKENYTYRRKLYNNYKTNRKVSFKTPEEATSFYNQQIRVKEYLEELYVRHSSYDFCEADDCIGYYCSICDGEDIIIMTADRDLLQLINSRISVYITSINTLFKDGDQVPLNGVFFTPQNIRVMKTICGDASDNIKGIKLVGVKSLLKIIPKIENEKISLDEIITEIKQKDKLTKKEKNILNGVTTEGEKGVEMLKINYKIIGIGKEFLTSEAIEDIHNICGEPLDPEGRHWKNALDLMMSDGILNILPKTNDAWVDFVRPFLRLTRIEKDFYIKKNKN